MGMWWLWWRNAKSKWAFTVLIQNSIIYVSKNSANTNLRLAAFDAYVPAVA